VAASRLFLGICIAVLVVIMAGVVFYAIGDHTRSMPFSCGDYSPFDTLPPECRRTSVMLYAILLIVLGSAVGFLWRKLGK
jgi:H+/gluconate symporter-like permease